MLEFLNSLGIVIWDWDPTFFSVGSVTVRYYGILFAIALAVGYMTLRWRYKDEGEDPESASNFAFAVGSPRRVSASSITSSCTSEAV